ncbi:Kinesin-6 like [Giardia muris]|uniref:Kinesin-like protein n=1 Tax=Giardia muris TaxID=5742 RepID=A0A4Z1SS82_GIAMU|nr:Kinesin-6 like [Giardia muris]|eukprot:TNJ28756.1 Kinesin-6 like [Giardia muris]
MAETKDVEQTHQIIGLFIGCRVRPPEAEEEVVIHADVSANLLLVHQPNGVRVPYRFDRVFGPLATQEEVFADVALPVLHRVLEGYSGAIMAYGATFSGKTFTISGSPLEIEARGLIPRSIELLFAFLTGHVPGEHRAALKDLTSLHIRDHSVTLSFIEIYMEKVRDLLDSSGSAEITSLPIRLIRSNPDTSSSTPSVEVQGLRKVLVKGPEHAKSVIDQAGARRIVGSNQVNLQSSRSHTILILDIMYTYSPVRDPHTRLRRTAQLHIVDLAGSESIIRTRAQGDRLTEAKYINTSLLALGRVVHKLSTVKDPQNLTHIPYRDSVLTRLLQNSLSGNSVTAILVHLSPGAESLSESLSTLKFAARAARVQTLPHQTGSVLTDDSTMTRSEPIPVISSLRRLVVSLYHRKPLTDEETCLLTCVLDPDITNADLATYCQDISGQSSDIDLSDDSPTSVRFDLRPRTSSQLYSNPDPEPENTSTSHEEILYAEVEAILTNTPNGTRDVEHLVQLLEALSHLAHNGDSELFIASLDTLQQATGRLPRACVAALLRISLDGTSLLNVILSRRMYTSVEPLLRLSPGLIEERQEEHPIYVVLRSMRGHGASSEHSAIYSAITAILSFTADVDMIGTSYEGIGLGSFILGLQLPDEAKYAIFHILIREGAPPSLTSDESAQELVRDARLLRLYARFIMDRLGECDSDDWDSMGTVLDQVGCHHLLQAVDSTETLKTIVDALGSPAHLVLTTHIIPCVLVRIRNNDFGISQVLLQHLVGLRETCCLTSRQYATVLKRSGLLDRAQRVALERCLATNRGREARGCRALLEVLLEDCLDLTE